MLYKSTKFKFIYTSNSDALWCAIYGIPIGHTSATSDWLLVYTIYPTDNV